eukprot:364063-Chlamydomonas_euryale.AAC.3
MGWDGMRFDAWDEGRVGSETWAFGFVRLKEAPPWPIRTHRDSSAFIRVHQQPSEFISSHQNSSAAIRFHQQPSEFIRANESLSESIGVHRNSRVHDGSPRFIRVYWR